MKKPNTNPVDQVENDEEAAQLVRIHHLVIFHERISLEFLVRK